MKNLVSIEQKIEKLICRLECGETIVLTLNDNGTVNECILICIKLNHLHSKFKLPLFGEVKLCCIPSMIIFYVNYLTWLISTRIQWCLK